MSGLEIRAAWWPLTRENASRLEAAVGVYEIRSNGTTELIGYAGARSAFGIRGELGALFASAEDGTEFRSEVVTTYLTRWAELLGWHLSQTGGLPPGNADHHPRHLRPVGPRKATS